VRASGFRALDPAAVPEDTRVLVSISDAGDANAFCGYLAACEQAGVAKLITVATFARIFLTRVCRWLPQSCEGPGPASGRSDRGRGICGCACRGGEPWKGCDSLPEFLKPAYERLLRRHPHAGRWAAVFDIARLLARMGLTTEAELRISSGGSSLFGLPSGRPPAESPQVVFPDRTLLFSASGRFFLGDLARRRMFELPPPLAVVADALVRNWAGSDAVDAIAHRLDLAAGVAEGLYRRGVAEFTRIGSGS